MTQIALTDIILGGNVAGTSLSDLLGWICWKAGEPWITDISGFPASPRSAQQIAAMNTDGQGNPVSSKLDFLAHNTTYGQPYVVVPLSQAMLPVAYDPTYGLTGYDGQTSAPIPFNPAVEGIALGGTLPTGLDFLDHHMILFTRDDTLGSPTYGSVAHGDELYSIYEPTSGTWGVSRFVHRYNGSGVGYDDRPEGFPTTNAGGTLIGPGLVRHDELTAAIAANGGAGGDLGHALRIGTSFVRNVYTSPARTGAGFSYPADSDVLCCGSRIRLRPGFDISGFSAGAKVILRTLKKFGAILDDALGGGSNWQLQGTLDAAWGLPYPYAAELRAGVDVPTWFEVLDRTKGFAVNFLGGASCPVNGSAVLTASILPPFTNISQSHNTGLVFVDYLDPACTIAAGGSFQPYRVDFWTGHTADQTTTYRPAGGAGPRYVLGFDNLLGREGPLAVPFQVGTQLGFVALSGGGGYLGLQGGS